LLLNLNSDTIVALITPPGQGAVGLIRLSGPQALACAEAVFRGRSPGAMPGQSVAFGRIVDGAGRELDEVLLTVFREPHSYTGEDVVEISCHGSPYILQELLDLLCTRGARPALAGEFTRRAWLNGKMDLSQAEAVADLIASESRAAHTLAINQLKGGIRDEIRDLRAALLDFCSLIELELDFSEEDVEFADRSKLINLLAEIRTRIDKLLDSFVLGNAIRQGVQTVIAGRPNAGKSTLLNALLGEERAIVSDIAGTTRDTVEERLNIQGVLFHLVDTAGLREARDQVEAMGIARSYEKIRQAAIVLYVYDRSILGADELQKDLESLQVDRDALILVANKADLASGDQAPDLAELAASRCLVAARTGQGVDVLKQLLYDTVLGKSHLSADSIGINGRHRNALVAARRELDATQSELQNLRETDLVAQGLRRVLYHLGEVSGEISSDEILGNIFGKFCIGK
jgi:tRNA modification GTPase